MKRSILFVVIALLILGIMAVVSLLAPLPIPHFQDFSVLYFSNLGLLNGIQLYDYPAQLNFVLAQTGPDFTFHPYPYPPWYALVTLPVALLPIEAAARLWFFLNLAMLAGALWLLTPRWKPIPGLLAFLAAVMFIPTFGLLVVGQYSLPVLLGAALFIWSARKDADWGLAASLALMTFKPHIGGFMALAALGWMLYRRKFRALGLGIGLGLTLAALGFAADLRWPLAYLESLNRYRDIPGVQTCDLCASLPGSLVRWGTGLSNTGIAARVSLVLGAGLVGLLVWRYRPQLADPTRLTVLSALFTLLVDPYLLNYDYVLLLAPLAVLAQKRRWLALLPYLAPWVLLAFGRAGNALLPLAGLLTLGLVLRLPIDSSPTQT